jgi:flagellar basal-body rod protein FlgF
MLRGIYTAAAGMLNTQLAVDTMANNVANVNTTGFKARYVQYQAYPEIQMSRIDDEGSQEIGKLTTGVEIIGTPLHFSQGHLQPTGNALDVAVDGDGFLVVQLPNGETGYTRNGSLKLNQQNELTSEGHYKVLDAGGNPITVPENAGKIVIQEDGTISTEAGQSFGKLQMVRFSNPKGLHQLGDSIFKGENPIDVQAAKGGSGFRQGYIERSNTNIVHEMIQSITGMRLYEGLQRTISTQKETLDKAVNEFR